MTEAVEMIGFLHDGTQCMEACVEFLMVEFKGKNINAVSYSIDGRSGTPEQNVKLVTECDVICLVLASPDAVRGEERCKLLNALLDEQSLQKRTMLVLDDGLDGIKQLKKRDALLYREKCSKLGDFTNWKPEKKQKLAKKLIEKAPNALKNVAY